LILIINCIARLPQTIQVTIPGSYIYLPFMNNGSGFEGCAQLVQQPEIPCGVNVIKPDPMITCHNQLIPAKYGSGDGRPHVGRIDQYGGMEPGVTIGSGYPSG
jgi:hypothetical protein